VAEETIRDVDTSGHWPGKVVTRISEAGPFWEAEGKDHDYFQRYPDGCAPPFPWRGVEAADRETAASSAD
jgi:peptide-methionine (S)-S-oxide reductase